MEGSLGCPNCRDAFPVRNGFGDLRAPPRGAIEPGFAGRPEGRETDSDTDRPDEGEGHPHDPRLRLEALRALLGIVGGPGTVVLMGASAALGARLAAEMPDVHVVGIDPDLASWPPSAHWTRMVTQPGLPFRSGSLRALVLDGRLGVGWANEALRAISRRGRLVILGADPPVRAWIKAERLSALELGEVAVVDVA